MNLNLSYFTAEREVRAQEETREGFNVHSAISSMTPWYREPRPRSFSCCEAVHVNAEQWMVVLKKGTATESSVVKQ